MISFNAQVEEYKSKEGVAHLFGVLLFTDEHPNIKKVLRDDDYWLSFHELTGDRFCVFSAKPEKGCYGFPSLPPGILGMMVPIWKEPSMNKNLLKVFDMENTKSLPMLLLFTQVNGEYLKIELSLDDKSIESSYTSIREQLESACQAIAKINKENIDSPEGLFAALSLHQDQRVFWQRVKNSIDIYGYIKRLIP